LTPTVTAAFVDAVSAIWRIKKPTLTHKTFSTNNNAELHFCLLVSWHRIIFLFTNIPRKEKGMKETIWVCYLSILSMIAN
jgi:hypothetical protein